MPVIDNPNNLSPGPGSTGGGYARISGQPVYNGNHSFSTDAFYLGNDIPVLDDANRNAITGVSFSQDGEGTDRTFGLDELEFTGAQRSFVGLVTVQNVDVHNANDQFSSSLSGGFQDVSVVSSGTADFTMNDGQVFQGIRVNFVRGPDGETFMMPDDGPSPYAFNAFRAMLFNNSSGIDSFTIATGSGDDAGINPIEGNWADGQFFELTDDVDPNQIVDGENSAEVMSPEYTDANAPTDSGGDIIDGADGDSDVILGNGGDDTINAGLGADEVYGGSGDDSIDGGAGNDTLTGDFASDVTDTVVDNSTVEGDDILEGGAGDDVIFGDSGNSLSAGGSGVLGDTLGDGPGSTGGGYARISGQPVYNGNHSFSTDAFYLGNDIPVLDDANRNAITGVSFSQDGEGTDRTFGLDELEFTGAQRSFVGLVTVQNVDVHNANDQFSSSLSGGFQDVSVVSSGTADFTMNDGQVFQGIRVNFVRGPDGETFMMPDDGPSPYAFNAFRAMLFNNSSGIDSFTIATGSGDDAGINPIEGNWADGQFFELTEGEGGDDTIIGGEGADQLFGEGGDDVFEVGSASEGAGDVIEGGNGPDQNTDFDVLDLRGAGAVTVDAADDENDAGALAGTVTFGDGSTLEFSQIEQILQDEPALTIEPAPDAPIDPATGNPLTAENGEPAQIVITRNTPTDAPLEVFLTNGDDTETDAPVSVIIPAGQDSVVVDIPSVDDPIVDGDQVSTITAEAPGFAPATQDVTVADDDDLELTIAPSPDQPVDPDTGLPVTQENGAPVELVITRNGPTDEPLVVTLTDGDPSETDSPVTVTIPAGEDSVTVLVDPVDDPDVDGDQTAPVTATAPGYGPTTQEVLVEDDDVPALTIEPAPGTPIDPATGLPVTQENGEPVELVVSRNTPTDAPLEVTIQNGDPSETNPPITVTIPAGETSVTFPVDPVDDPEVDGDQTSPITATAPGFEPDTQGVLVEDDDVPTLTIEPAPGAPIDPATGNPLTAENGEPAQIVITRNTPTDAPLEVFLTNGDDTETDAPVSVIIPAGQDSVVVDIPSVDDPIVDGDQVSTITAEAPGFAPATQDVTVADDDDLELTIAPSPDQPVDPDTGLPVTQENGAPVELVITRNGPTDEPLVVTLTDGDPSETDSPVTVTIPAGEDSVTVLVDPVDDPDVDGDQTAPVTATAPGYGPTTQEVLVEDDDVPALTIEPAPGTPIDPATGLPVTQENGEPVELVVSRNTPTDAPLEVTIQNGDPSETNPPITVTIPAGETSVTFPVDPVDDPEVDGDQTSPITATAPGFEPDTQGVLVEDDDVPTLTIEPAPGAPIDPATGNPLTAENGEPAQIVITRNTPTDAPLEVFLTNGDDTETDAPVSVIIPAGQDSVVVDIPSVDDPIVDGDQVSTITAEAPGFAPATQDVTVADDDDLELTIAPSPDQPVDPDTGLPVTQENGAPVELVITRNGPTDEPLVVTLTDGDPSETDSPVTVTIPAGEDSVTVLVDPVDDPDVDGDQTAPVTATAPGYGPTTQEVLVEDDDVAQFAPVAGDDNANTDENTPATIDVLENDVDPDGDNALLQITNASVVSGGGSVAVENNQLVYTPAAGFDGAVVLSYEITDPQGLTDTALVNVHVADAGNSAPTANRDFAHLDYADYLADANGITNEGNALDNDTDPDGDPLVVVAVGETDTPNSNGWFAWTEASRGGEIRLNEDGRAQFRDPDGDFASVPVGDTEFTWVDYTIADPSGEMSTSYFKVFILGSANPDSANTVTAEDDQSNVQVDDLGVLARVNIGNVLDNDFDAETDHFDFTQLGNDGSANGNGWFGWVDGSEGGQFRVNESGQAQFRDRDGDFDYLAEGQSIDTFVDYQITDARGATDTARITVTVDAEEPVDPIEDWMI